MKLDVERMIQQPTSMKKTPLLFCPLNLSSQFATNTSGLNVHWMLHQIDNEISQRNQILRLFVTKPLCS